MQVSASVLGQEYGLTGEEMNRLFLKQGILTGEPGSYDLTTKGHQYAVTKDFHRGTGGYAHYNRYWTTRTYDENIKDVLDLSAETIAEVKKEVADSRAARYAAQAANRLKANNDFLAREAEKKAEKIAEEKATKETIERIVQYKKVGKIGLVIVGVTATCYGVYRSAPKVKRWWNSRKEIVNTESNQEWWQCKSYSKKGKEIMFKKQVTALTAILKDKDIREYSGDAFWNIIKAVVLGDVGALLDVTNDLKDILFHTPTVLFWDKMQRYLFGTFRDYSDQVKMSAKFTNDNSDYEAFVKKQIHLINEMNDDKKIDYFAMLTRCYLLFEMEDALYYKLARFINICTPEELEYIKAFDFNRKSKLNVIISSLYQYGLFDQIEKEHGGVDYELSSFAKALKSNSLNFSEELNGTTRILSYNQISPLKIAEPATWEDIESILNDEEVIINGNGHK